MNKQVIEQQGWSHCFLKFCSKAECSNILIVSTSSSSSCPLSKLLLSTSSSLAAKQLKSLSKFSASSYLLSIVLLEASFLLWLHRNSNLFQNVLHLLIMLSPSFFFFSNLLSFSGSITILSFIISSCTAMPLFLYKFFDLAGSSENDINILYLINT